MLNNPVAEFYTLALMVATVAACIWAYYRTRLPATLAYGIWTLVSRCSSYVSQNYMHAIMQGKAGLNLGANIGERMSAYSVLGSLVFSTFHAAFLLWLFVSLALAARLKNGDKESAHRQ